MRIALDRPEHVATIKQHGKSFYLAGSFLGRDAWQRASALYAFLRHIDDQIDEAEDAATAARALTLIRQQLLVAELTEATADDCSLAIKQSTLQQFLRGMAYDIGTVAIADQGELEDYCYCVAGTVGEMMCQALRCDDPRATNHAIDLGIAMQMTNIARDVYADSELGRRYLPESWVGGLDAIAIRAAKPATAALIQSAIMRLIALSEQRYQSAYAGIALLPLRSRLAILAASRLYAGIGRAIAADKARDWQQRKVLSAPRKALITAAAVAEFATHPRLWRYQPRPSLGKPAERLANTAISEGL
jgi:phytoene synthase